MEDTHSIQVLDVDDFPHIFCFAVYDGHGGKRAAMFCKEHMGPNIADEFRKMLRNHKKSYDTPPSRPIFPKYPCISPTSEKYKKDMESQKKLAGLWYVFSSHIHTFQIILGHARF